MLRRHMPDVAFALLCTIADPSLLRRLGAVGEHPWGWIGPVTLVVVPVGVLLRWRYPKGAFTAVLFAALLALFGGWSVLPIAAAAWTLYPVALTSNDVPVRSLLRPLHLTVAVGTLVASCLIALLLFGEWTFALLASLSPLALLAPVALAAPFGLSWALGRMTRGRNLREEHDAEMERERVRDRERLRVAREVHDIVSHTLGTVGVRAGVVRHVHGDDPRKLAEALEEIERAARSATEELRYVLSALRANEERAPMAPEPGTAQLPALVESARAVGVECELDVRGAERLPEAVAVCVHRIVQEALTNVVRHAPGTSCSVMVDADTDPTSVEIEVLDIGPARNEGDATAPVTVRPSPGSGTGLIGMRERVALYGGDLVTGPRDQGGHRVHARIPLTPGIEKGDR
ncbi:sensor histidine kinase [Nocardiopsis alba]|uniref:sensor histidine kinase n=1 Tax=Nocardiopsis alba TaxID=53437 RepID=UPI0033B5F56F